MAPPLLSALRAGAACLSLALMVGVVLGFQALKYILLAEGAYGCTSEDVSCAPAHAQFICSLTLLNLSSVPATWCSHRRPVLTSCSGCILASLGYLTMMLAALGYGDALYFIGYQMIAVGGVSACWTFVSYGTSFPGWGSPPWSTLLGSMLPATFDFSAMVLQVWKTLYQSHGVSLVRLCWITALIPAACCLLMPWIYADTVPMVGGGPAERDPLLDGDDDASASDDAPKPAVESPIARWLRLTRDPLVGLLTLWAVFMMTCKYWWFDNVQAFMQWRLGDDDQAQKLYDGFNIATPLASGAMLFTTPLFTWSIPGALVVMGILSAAVGALTAAPNFALQGLNLGIVLFNRFFFFAALTTVALQLFGGERGGAVISFTLSCGALTTLFGVGLDALVRRSSDFYWLNMPLNMTAGVVCISVGAVVAARQREDRKQQQPGALINQREAAAAPAASGSASDPQVPEH
eukprot:TRINITY_DN70724_c0_g1_i1.p1 TRINITY_DN70724_c0_g1~~TRINITY_DN70724_c0_g1_i1.p1  ORF type:complete len:463 (+),score=127.37 TRINITY_DN70724_c0_g1_i1:88-1476(+)